MFSFLFCVSCLLLSLFCKSRHSNVFFKNILIVKIYIENINKNIFNNFLIAESRHSHTLLFQKLLNPAPAPKSRNAPVLRRCLREKILHVFNMVITNQYSSLSELYYMKFCKSYFQSKKKKKKIILFHFLEPNTTTISL